MLLSSSDIAKNYRQSEVETLHVDKVCGRLMCVGTVHVGTVHVGTVYVGTVYVGTVYVGTVYVGTVHVGTVHVGTVYVGTVYVGTVYVGTVRWEEVQYGGRLMCVAFIPKISGCFHGWTSITFSKTVCHQC